MRSSIDGGVGSYLHADPVVDEAPSFLTQHRLFVTARGSARHQPESCAVPRVTNKPSVRASYLFLLQWEWYEWLGAIAPFFLLWLIWRSSKKEPQNAVGVMSLSLIAYGWFYIALAFVLTIPVYFQGLARLQPMRSLHLLYILMFLFVGGLLGRHVLRRQPLRWIALLAPICVTMTVAQRQILPGSPHIEWPNKRPTNDWLLAFDWIPATRRSTPFLPSIRSI